MDPTAWVQTVVLPLTSHKKNWADEGLMINFLIYKLGIMTLPTSKGWL